MNWQSPLPDDVLFYRELYKYRTLHTPNGEVNQFTRDIFTSRALWFDKPASFNDPFDCNLPLKATQVPPNVMVEARAIIRGMHPNLEENLLEEILHHVGQEDSVINGSLQKERDFIYSQSSVLCWATRADNIGMFSYYADSHRGICLQFTLEHRHPLAIAMEVEYEEHFPNLDYNQITGTVQLVKSLILTKAKCWQHEGEQRVFRRGIPPGNEAFPPGALVRVIFGCRSAEEDISLVKSWLVGWPTPVVLAKAKPDKQSFTLRIEDLETITPHSIKLPATLESRSTDSPQ